jgi:hypothetical protein
MVRWSLSKKMCMFLLPTDSLRFGLFSIRLRLARKTNEHRGRGIAKLSRVHSASWKVISRFRLTVNLCIASGTFLICRNANGVLMVPHR